MLLLANDNFWSYGGYTGAPVAILLFGCWPILSQISALFLLSCECSCFAFERFGDGRNLNEQTNNSIQAKQGQSEHFLFAYFIKMLDCSVQVLKREMRRLFFVRHGELLSNALFHVARSQQSIIGRYTHLVRRFFDVLTLFCSELGILGARCILGRCICGDLHCKNRRVQRCKS